MLVSRKFFAAAAACSVLLAACGGGNDDDPTPSDKAGVLTVSQATIASLNGIYGDGTLNLTDVERNNPIGPKPEQCAFKFNGAKKVGASNIEAFGDVRYESGRDGLYEIYLTFDGKEYQSNEMTNTAVRRDLNQVFLTSKILMSGDGSSVKVNAIIPMRGDRPGGC